MKPKRYRGKLTIAAAVQICLQILKDNAPQSGNTFELSLGHQQSERCQAIRRLITTAKTVLHRDADHAWKRRKLRAST